MTKVRIVIHVRFHLLVCDLFLFENLSSERCPLTLLSGYPLFFRRISKSRAFFKTRMGKICYSKRQCVPFYEPSCYSWWTPGTSAVGPFVEHKYMFFTVKNSRLQSINHGLHFLMSYDGFGSGMRESLRRGLM